jgi:hypothetical protein|tara:strand:- start:179 stop:424 length:246 start_codon:yes stop_codon:yes gene_type:complete
MRMPKEITQAWLKKKGWELVQLHRPSGYRLYFVTKKKGNHCTLIEAANLKKKREHISELRGARPVIRKKGKWIVDMDSFAY